MKDVENRGTAVEVDPFAGVVRLQGRRPRDARFIGHFDHEAAGTADERDRQAGGIAPRHLPADRHVGRAAQAHRERVPDRVGIGATQRGEPPRIADEHANEVGVAGQLREHRSAGAVPHPPSELERLDRAERSAARQPRLDRPPQAADEGMQPIGQDGDEPGGRILADHVEFIRPEHRQLERLGEHERAAGLHEFANALGASLVPECRHFPC